MHIKHFELLDSPEAYLFGREELEKYGYPEPPDRLTEYHRVLSTSAALIFVFPIWMYGVPSCLKGLFENLFKPGLTFNVTDSGIQPLLTNIRTVLIICSSGQRQPDNLNMDMNEQFFSELIAHNMGPDCQLKYLRLWGTDTPDSQRDSQFVKAAGAAIDAISSQTH